MWVTPASYTALCTRSLGRDDMAVCTRGLGPEGTALCTHRLVPRTRLADSFEKTLILGKIEGRRRRGQQRMR